MTFFACWRKFAETILDVPRLGCLCSFLCFAVDGSVESFRFIACRSCGIEKMVVENGGVAEEVIGALASIEVG